MDHRYIKFLDYVVVEQKSSFKIWGQSKGTE
ncbi:MAG: hypothetical protein ACJAW7_002414 [Candidatus Azotimanducaceae bacterium]|jgi:hypothetical protein